MNASGIRRPRRARRHIRRSSWPHPLRFEALEDRTLLATVHWVGTDGDWDDPADWSTGSVPGSGDDVVLDSGPYTVTLDQGASVHSLIASTDNLVLAGGSLALGAASEIDSTFTYSSGGLSPGVNLTIGSTGTLNISGDTDKTLTEGVINNQGTTIWTGSGNLQFYGGATFNNLAGSTFVAENDAAMLWIGYAQGNFNNAGTFRKQGTGGTTTLTSYGFAFNNSGLLDVQSGTATVAGSEGGAFNTATGATLDFSGGTLEAGALLTGTGLTEVTGGLTLAAALTTPADFALDSGGVIDGPGDLTVAGVLTWDDGQMGGTGTTVVAAGGQIDLEGGSCNRTIDSTAGPLDWSAGGLGGTFTDVGTMNITGDSAKTLTNCILSRSGETTWTGAGNLQFYSGSAINNLAGSTFVAENDAAMLWTGYAQGNFNNAGTFRKQGTGGTTTLTSYGFAFNNSGLLDVQSGTATIAGSEDGTFNTATGATLDLAGGTLDAGTQFTGTGLTKVTGILTLAAALTAPGNFELDSGGLIEGTSSLTVAGTMLWFGGSIQVSTFSNQGTVEAEAGVQMQSPVSQVSAATLTGGRWVILAHASLSLSSSPLLTNNGADVTLAGPGASFSNLGDLTENDGALSLLDGATFGTSGNLLNAGTLSLGTGSVLNVGGNFTQGPGATLGFQLGGTPASGLFGQLKSTGTATLAGTLNIAVTGGYVPSAGDRFAVMSYASASGTFSSITGLSAGRTQLLEAVVGSASVVIDSLIDAADLAMGTITIPANGVAGQDATINYTVTNNAANPTDSNAWVNSIYLTQGTTLDPSAILIGRVQHVGRGRRPRELLGDAHRPAPGRRTGQLPRARPRRRRRLRARCQPGQ